jgi:hypothetical protein
MPFNYFKATRAKLLGFVSKIGVCISGDAGNGVYLVPVIANFFNPRVGAANQNGNRQKDCEQGQSFFCYHERSPFIQLLGNC